MHARRQTARVLCFDVSDRCLLYSTVPSSSLEEKMCWSLMSFVGRLIDADDAYLMSPAPAPQIDYRNPCMSFGLSSLLLLGHLGPGLSSGCSPRPRPPIFKDALAIAPCRTSAPLHTLHSLTGLDTPRLFKARAYSAENAKRGRKGERLCSPILSRLLACSNARWASSE